LQELQDIDKKGGDDKAWRKSFVRACNHAAMRRVQKDKQTGSDDEGDNDCVSLGSRYEQGLLCMTVLVNPTSHTCRAGRII